MPAQREAERFVDARDKILQEFPAWKSHQVRCPAPQRKRIGRMRSHIAKRESDGYSDSRPLAFHLEYEGILTGPVLQAMPIGFTGSR